VSDLKGRLSQPKATPWDIVLRAMPGLKGRFIRSRMNAPVGVEEAGDFVPQGSRLGLDEAPPSGPHFKRLCRDMGNDTRWCLKLGLVGAGILAGGCLGFGCYRLCAGCSVVHLGLP